MKLFIKILVLSVIVILTSSSLSASGKSKAEKYSNKDNDIRNAQDIHTMCWRGSNSGNQHDELDDDYKLGDLKDRKGRTIKNRNTGKYVHCTATDGKNGNKRPPKHCTHTNKHGNKHKNSASGC
jgi:hypothetical protein